MNPFQSKPQLSMQRYTKYMYSPTVYQTAQELQLFLLQVPLHDPCLMDWWFFQPKGTIHLYQHHNHNTLLPCKRLSDYCRAQSLQNNNTTTKPEKITNGQIQCICCSSILTSGLFFSKPAQFFWTSLIFVNQFLINCLKKGLFFLGCGWKIGAWLFKGGSEKE